MNTPHPLLRICALGKGYKGKLIIAALLLFGVTLLVAIIASSGFAEERAFEDLMVRYCDGELSEQDESKIRALCIRHGDSLIDMATYKEGRLRELWRNHIQDIPQRERIRQRVAEMGFFLMGTNGIRHLPELQILLHRSSEKITIARCIGLTGIEGGKILLKEAENSNPEIRAAAIVGFVALENMPLEYMDKIAGYRKDAEPDVRENVGIVMAKHGHQSKLALQVLESLLEDKEPDVVYRVVCSIFLNNWRNPELIAKLRKMLPTSDEGIKLVIERTIRSYENNKTNTPVYF